jgi:hypothetical protein
MIFVWRFRGLTSQSCPHAAHRHTQQRDSGFGGGREQVFQLVDGGRRRLRCIRAKLERVCRISIYEFWIHHARAAAFRAIDDFDNEGQRDRVRRELQIQPQGTSGSRLRGGDNRCGGRTLHNNEP